MIPSKMHHITLRHRRFTRSEYNPNKMISEIEINGETLIILAPEKFTRFLIPGVYYDLECYPFKQGKGFSVCSYKKADLKPLIILNPELTELNISCRGEIWIKFSYQYPSKNVPRNYYEKMKSKFIQTFGKDSLLSWKQALQSIAVAANLDWELQQEYIITLPEGMTGDSITTKITHDV